MIIKQFKNSHILIVIILMFLFDFYYHKNLNLAKHTITIDDNANSQKTIDCDLFYLDPDQDQGNEKLITMKDDPVSLKMISVKGGCYLMGSPAWEKGRSDNESQQMTCLADFLLSQTEVTQQLWFEVMGNKNIGFEGCGGDFPITQVSWDEIHLFIKRLNSLMHKNYRLPTEEEWEYACRNQGQTTKYCGDDNIDNIAWYVDNSSSKVHRVAQKKPNGLGFYDMSGNVGELTSSCYKNDCQMVVERGGSSYYDDSFQRAAVRTGFETKYSTLNTGIRLAHDIKLH